jgi:magnesium-transporting ATPase (P-type)
MIFKSCTVGGKVYKERSPIERIQESRSPLSNEDLQRQNRSDNNYELNWEDECRKGSDLYEFFHHMTLCHSVTVDNESKKKEKKVNNLEGELMKEDEETDYPVYQCQSPDELALVQAACKVGI